MKKADGEQEEYLPEQQAEPLMRAVGCAVCARYSAWVSVVTAACTREGAHREVGVNRGGTA